MHRWILIALAVAFMAGPAFAFKDVPANHWAYEAIDKAVKAGILQGYNDEFFGKRNLNRFQMAVVVARLLEKIGEAKPGMAAPSGDALKQLEALVTEFADELALLNVKVGKLEETVNAMGKGTVAKAEKSADGTALKFHGIFKNWYVLPDSDTTAVLPTGENERFEVRNAILAFEYAFTDDIKLKFSNDFAGAGFDGNTPGGLLDMRVDIKLPNSENIFAFGSFRPEITAYGYADLNKLDFLTMPIGYSYLGSASFGLLNAGPSSIGLFGVNAGIGWQNGFMVDFKGKKDDKMTFKLGMFNGGNNANIAPVGDDEDKALMLAVNFKGTSKLHGGIWYYSDEATANPGPGAEFDGMGLHVKYVDKSFTAMFEYMSGDYNIPVSNDEFDSMMLQFIVPMQKNKTDFLLRWEQVDYDRTGLTVDTGDWDRITIGFKWYMNPNCVWQLEYWSDEFDGGNVAGGAGLEPSTIALQLMTFF